jgi:hypothetical protein
VYCNSIRQSYNPENTVTMHQRGDVQSTNFSWAFALMREQPTEVGTLNTCVHASRLASIVISAFNTFETGHPALALLAAVSNACASAPGTFALTSK